MDILKSFQIMGEEGFMLEDGITVKWKQKIGNDTTERECEGYVILNFPLPVGFRGLSISSQGSAGKFIES